MSDKDIIMDDVEYGSLFRRISAFMIDLLSYFTQKLAQKRKSMK